MEAKKLKWGILGTGRIAKVFATALLVVENCELYAVGSRDLGKAQQFASEFNVPKAFGSYEEFMNNPEIDVVYIATPHNLHLENALMALNQNKHVLCEKPMGINLKEVNLLIAKAEEKNLFLMEALWSRFIPNIQKTKELIDAGEIGEVRLMTAYFSFKSNNSAEHRHFNPELCGGTILDIGIYNIFLALYLFGKPQSIAAIAGLNEKGIDTTSSYTFKYEDSKLAVMYSSFMADSPVVAEIHGTKGKISLEDRWFCPGKVRLKYHTGIEKVFEFEVKGSGYECEAEEVVKCIYDGKKQSELWSWENNRELYQIMDSIRKDCGIIYPKHDY